MPANRGLSRPLAALLRWWMQTQVTQAQGVQVSLRGASQAWWSGCLPHIQVCAENIIYQEIHLHRVALTAENIRFHLPFLQKKGEPFLEPITVQIQATITAENVNHSLPYLQETLRPYLQQLHPEATAIQGLNIHSQGINWLMDNGEQYTTQVKLVSPNELTLIADAHPHQQVSINLGTDVQIQELMLQSGAVHLTGDLIIRPAAPTE
ncbi:hypothetical protein GlitD10_1711 [Gloeomargarita lithophora Alchichica-D10]|uniref:DUF2993 domain-containing protein n=1 Tax=Gloeomargarita lithophora Alchichica-D10 TaxID=1188229 RepID=A0A1J0ADM2_9CYAN|nr:DUF2993 domain-containing protein [Gloeomargarita lithophora]APB34036.1 hypothetical protein GlitD10_1711 [Gloeomargarita lithophora Alchichica-D10]